MNQRTALTEARRALFEAREKRIHPGQDEKVLTSWNGLMLAAFAEAERALNRDEYRRVAERDAEFRLRELRQEDGRLLQTWEARPERAEGAGEAKLNGYLEDYDYLNDLRTIDIARHALAQMQTPTGGGMMSQYPLGFGQWLQALSCALSQPTKIAIVGDPDATETQALLTVVRSGYRPFQVVALGSPDCDTAVPLLIPQGKKAC